MAVVRPAPSNIEQVRQMVAEEMTRLVEASYALLSAVLVPDDENAT